MPIPVPQPPESFLIGNLKEIDPEYGLGSLQRLANLYGPIYRLNILGQKLIILSSQELVNEASSTSTWEKTLPTALKEIRALAGDGLFTAYNHEANWKLAHKILIPAFGPGNIRAMFPDMYDIASQLILKWERFGEDNRIDVANDFTRHVSCITNGLTLDTIALCSFSYRFNSFYKETMHPFVEAMVDVLLESGQRTRRLAIQQTLMVRASRKYQQDIDYLHDLCDKIVSERKAHPTDSKDLLNLMLNGRDKETGEGLTVENIRYQMVTFLIAGHETTSGLLSFAFYYLLRNPHTLQKAQEEVDRVTQGQPLTLDHLPHLKYIDAVLKEALRLNPTAPLFVVKPKQTSGSYTFATGHEIDASENCGILLSVLHKDPKVWGDDADVFRPERMLNGGFENLPPNSWKPFGNGMRACIGRPFAWQESLIVVAMILQRFNLEFVDPGYDLRVKQTLTIKPVGFEMRARVRKGSRPVGSVGVGPVHSPATPPAHSHVSSHGDVKEEEDGVVAKKPVAAEEKREPSKITILYGSNSGSCESFAERVASDATSHGFTATTATLDSAIESLPTDQPVIIICPSYEGQPADNAKRFVSWVTSLTTSDGLKGVKYAVFGAGHHDWAATYHRIPRLIDDTLGKLGAERFLERGETDAAGDFFGDFESWEDKLWPALRSLLHIPATAVEELTTQRRNSLEDLVVPSDGGTTGPLLDVEILNEQRAAVLGHKDFRYGVVVENRKLTGDELQCGSLAKRHVEIRLPEGLAYRAGDYLAVMPVNPIKDIKRVLNRFTLPVDAAVLVKSSTKTYLPTNRPMPVHTLLGGYVELSQPASRRHIETLLQLAAPEDKSAFEALQDPETYIKQILEKRVSLLDILEQHPTHPLPFSHFLSLLPPMRMRQYSISSSPLWNPTNVTITFDVLVAPSLSGTSTKVGVASNYLAHTAPGDHIACTVRPSAAPFHLPAEIETPVIMIATGSGISPMRGFIQERAMMVECGRRKVGKAVLYYGCRDKEEDFIYENELEEWEKLGAVEVRPTFSRTPAAASNESSGDGNTGETKPPRYVYERIWEDRDELAQLFVEGEGRVYVCGSNRLSKSAQEVCVRIVRERKGVSEEEAKDWFEKQKGLRYATDVFG